MTLRDKLFGFNGRLRRQDWWLLGIAVGILHNLLLYVSTRLLGLDGEPLIGGTMPVIGDPWPVLAHSLVFSFLFGWPQLALTAKRAHDINRAAWPFIVVTIAIQALSYWPVNDFTLAGPAPEQADLWIRAAPWIVNGATLVAVIGLLVVLGFLDGTAGPNRFGSSPKALSEGPPAFMAPGGLE